MQEFDSRYPDTAGEMEPLELTPSTIDIESTTFGIDIRKHMTKAALETLASWLLNKPKSRTLILCRNSTEKDRSETLYLLVESFYFACGFSLPVAISDAPTLSALNYFNLVISPKGIKADANWVFIDAALEKPLLPRVIGKDFIYEKIEKIGI
jgi:hypothetical protein